VASDDKTTEPVEGSWAPRRPRTAAEQRAKPSADPEVLASEIERTRAELAETLDAIADKVSPKRVVKRTTKKVGDAAKEGATEAADAAKTGATDTAAVVKASVSDAVGAAKLKTAETSEAVKGATAEASEAVKGATAEASEAVKEAAVSVKAKVAPAPDHAWVESVPASTTAAPAIAVSAGSDAGPPIAQPPGTKLPRHEAPALDPVQPSRVPMLVGAGAAVAVVLLVLRRRRR